MATTTNFGWETPDDTDLVKDGAAAIRTALNGVDTSFVDLKGGTTGQILSKNSNTDLDYTWVTNDVGDITAVTAGTGISGGGTSGAVTITNSMATAITTAGDLIKGTGSGTFDRLGIGSNGQVLTVTAGAPVWASPSGTTFPTFAAYLSTTQQSFSSSTFTKVQLNAESWDTANCFDPSTNYRFTPNVAGYYQFNAMISLDCVTMTENIVAIYKNGSKAGWPTYTANGSNNAPTINGSLLLYMNGSTDYVEMYVYATGSGLKVAVGDNATVFSGVGIRS